MDLKHPLDAALRERLKAAGPKQQEFGKAIGRSAGWVNKYMHGAGNATIDDVVRIVALLIGVEVQPLTAIERRLLKAWRKIHPDRQDDAVVVLENVSKGYRRPQSQGSDGPEVRTPQATERTARGKR